jgi:hypothetical protein
MPFSGSPVCPLSNCRRPPRKTTAPLIGLHAPPRLSQPPCCRGTELSNRDRTANCVTRCGRSTPSTTLMGFLALQRISRLCPSRRGCQASPEPAGRFYVLGGSAQRAAPATRQAYFIPAPLMSFDLQGLGPPRDPPASPRPILPCRYPPPREVTDSTSKVYSHW